MHPSPFALFGVFFDSVVIHILEETTPTTDCSLTAIARKSIALFVRYYPLGANVGTSCIEPATGRHATNIARKEKIWFT